MKDYLDRLLSVPRYVRVFDPQNKHAARMAGIKPIEQGRSGAPNMKKSRRAWSKSHAHTHNFKSFKSGEHTVAAISLASLRVQRYLERPDEITAEAPLILNGLGPPKDNRSSQERLSKPSSADARFDWMIGQVKRAQVAERERAELNLAGALQPYSS